MYKPVSAHKDSCDISASSYTRTEHKGTNNTPAHSGRVRYESCQNVAPSNVVVSRYTKTAKDTHKRNPAIVGSANLTTTASKVRAVDPATAGITVKRSVK